MYAIPSSSDCQFSLAAGRELDAREVLGLA